MLYWIVWLICVYSDAIALLDLNVLKQGVPLKYSTPN